MNTAKEAAAAFIRLLPMALAQPEQTDERSGAVTLSWRASDTQRITVELDNLDRLVFDFTDGADHSHGMCYFDGERIPDLVMNALRHTLAEAGQH